MNLSQVKISESLGALVDKLQAWLNSLILVIPNMVVALGIVVITALIARLVENLAHRAMNRVTGQKTLNSLASTIAKVLTFAIGLFVALGVMGLDKTVTSLLAGAGVVGLALAFAFQDIAQNFMSGILLALRRPVAAGDIVETNDFFGTVLEVNLRSTILRTPQGEHVIIPNSKVIQSPVKNYSRTGQHRVDISCGVAYGDDLEKVEKLAVECLEGLDFIDSTRPVDFYYTEFGDSSINFKLRFWIEYKSQADFLRAQSTAIKALKVAFEQAGVTIPFPIRTLDFGVVGGVNLNEVLPKKLYQNGDSRISEKAAHN